jgi:DNA-binding helix-hairpin-helix protein with protein kinase domain
MGDVLVELEIGQLAFARYEREIRRRRKCEQRSELAAARAIAGENRFGQVEHNFVADFAALTAASVNLLHKILPALLALPLTFAAA